MPRLGIVTALMAEAVPLIDFYRLQKQTKRPGFHCFSSEVIDLIICGMGADHMALGLNAYFNSPTLTPHKWLNLGIAGSKFDPIGSLLWAASIDGFQIGYPERSLNQRAMNVISLSKPSTDYKVGNMFDMEAGAYLRCIQENVADFQNTSVFCAKVISDNASQNSLNMDKVWVTSLIRENLNELDRQIIKLIKS